MLRWQALIGVLAAIAGAGGLAVGLMGRRDLTTSQQREADLAARLATLEAAASAKSSPVGRARPPVLLAPSPSAAMPSVAPVASAAMNDMARRRELAHTSAVELGEAYQAKFDTETVDPAWARSATREYRAAIDSRLPETSRFVSFECRSEFCRLEVIHESIKSSNDFLEHLFSQQYADPIQSGFRAAPPTSTDDGKLRYVVYIARPGVSVALETPPPQ